MRLRLHALLFFVLLLTAAAVARSQDFSYTNINGTITITGYNGPGGNVTIPDTITGRPVTRIGTSAFFNKSSLSQIAMGNSVSAIGDYAFASCSNLANLAIGGSVADLGDHAFDSCISLTNITIPDSVTNIHDAHAGCFGSCVDGGVFGGCTRLTNVVVGKGLTYLGLGAFSGCSNLLSVYFEGDAPTVGFTVVGYEDIFGPETPAAYVVPTTVYYMPGTTGWGSTLAYRPTLLWNPQIQTSDASFGVRQNGFGFNITGTSNIPIVIEACTNLGAGSCVPLESCTLTNGLVYFGDPQWANYPRRLYRIRSP
jgi:hypothetical protein